MQFDPKASTPKVLFSPAAAVNSSDLEVLQRQGKSAAAEQAVKLTVYQSDSAGEEVVIPQVASAPVADVVDEPVLRSTEDAKPQVLNNANDVMKKWSVKS
jgi:hypothetical protein